eukprot:1158084-Pelagomonas_calceolata.AAC.1
MQYFSRSPWKREFESPAMSVADGWDWSPIDALVDDSIWVAAVKTSTFVRRAQKCEPCVNLSYRLKHLFPIPDHQSWIQEGETDEENYLGSENNTRGSTSCGGEGDALDKQLFLLCGGEPSGMCLLFLG